MKQCKKFQNPVYAAGGNNILAVATDTVTVILKSGETTTVTLTDASADGRWICWDQAATAASPRSEDVRAVESAHHFDCTKYGGAENPEPTGNIDSDADGIPDHLDPKPNDPNNQL